MKDPYEDFEVRAAIRDDRVKSALFDDEEGEAFYCQECGDECKAIEDSWDYPATHCTHGKGGVYYSSYFVSDCCGADIDIIPPDFDE